MQLKKLEKYMSIIEVKKIKRFILFLLMTLLFVVNCNTERDKMEEDFKTFLNDFESKVIPLTQDYNISYFEATTSGKEELYKKMEKLRIELTNLYSNKEDFSHLKRFKNSEQVKDPVLKRQLYLIYNTFLENQLDEEKLKKIIEMETDLERKFSTYRVEVDGKFYTDNEIENILKQSNDSKYLEKAWKSSKKIGGTVSEDILKLVELRNQAAQELGFENYHTMKLNLNEQDPEEINDLFRELEDLTRNVFIGLKEEIDGKLAQRYGIKKDNLMPWHYQNRFFQEAPKIYSVDLDQFYQDQDIVKVTAEYFNGIGLPIDDLIKNSDLFEKEGKYQHAYCTDIDRVGDVRVVCNIKPNYNWMNTTLHEYGHAVYDKFNDRSLAWFLRQPASTFKTEAIAMFFGNFASSPRWMEDVLGISSDKVDKISEDCLKSLRLETLVFSRWAQVMYRFEKNMYKDPKQDLNNLWWNIVEKYQMIKRPAKRDEPDWASKIHVALYPAYYHNYLLGNIFASQIQYNLAKNVLKDEAWRNQSFADNKEIGRYLIENIFKPGKRYPWNEMIEKATGEKLTAKYYAMQFVN
jgi:peptidyl-dipeptidase A